MYLLGDGFSIFSYSARLVRQWIHARASVLEVLCAGIFYVKTELGFRGRRCVSGCVIMEFRW